MTSVGARCVIRVGVQCVRGIGSLGVTRVGISSVRRVLVQCVTGVSTLYERRRVKALCVIRVGALCVLRVGDDGFIFNIYLLFGCIGP